jgi:hypothetical protein
MPALQIRIKDFKSGGQQDVTSCTIDCDRRHKKALSPLESGFGTLSHGPKKWDEAEASSHPLQGNLEMVLQRGRDVVRPV